MTHNAANKYNISKNIHISRCIISIHFAKKICFVYFTHFFLQNIHISLSILHIYLIKYLFLTQYPTTINDQTKKKGSIGNHQPSLCHQPTYQNPKTTNQNHQNPLIKTIKTTYQNHQNPLIKIPKPLTKKKDSNSDR